jgi:ERF superfamily
VGKKQIMKTLAEIQAAVKAPKGNFNSFGKYKYRSAEDILEAVKPVINPHGFHVTIYDEIVLIGDRFYVKATAEISNGENAYTSVAFAREEELVKGMSAPQVTGSASSYARKYALSGLLALDDTKDADDTNEHQDEVGQEKRDYLISLIENSTFEERQRVQLRQRANNITKEQDYERAKASLLANQMEIEGSVNPSMKQINKRVKDLVNASE